eukprot:s2795_g3.t1
MADLRRRRDGATGEFMVAVQSEQVAGGGSSQSLQVAGGGSSQSAPETGGAAMQGPPAAGAEAELTADQKLDELLEGLSKKENQVAAVKSVRATEAAGSGLVAGLSPEQRRWLADAAEAMRAGQTVAMPTAAAAPEALALVLDTKEVMTGDTMVAAIKEIKVGKDSKVVENGVTIWDKDMELITELKLAVVAFWGLLHFLLDLL